jgi:Bacterial regulatory helix-turn-helix protein, lysR family
VELHQVRYFLALCKEKNFTRAAKHCGVSQPSLSNAIKRLEQELGGPLFHRDRVNCGLSELGRVVWPHLAKLDQSANDARTQAERFVTAPSPSASAFEQVRSLIHGSLALIWGSQSSMREGYKMRKPAYVIGACALLAAGYFVWSQPALVSSYVQTVSASVVPQGSALGVATSTARAMPPTGLNISAMQQSLKNLPEEKLDDLTFIF